jgi:hypothetical protein
MTKEDMSKVTEVMVMQVSEGDIKTGDLSDTPIGYIYMENTTRKGTESYRTSRWIWGEDTREKVRRLERGFPGEMHVAIENGSGMDPGGLETIEYVKESGIRHIRKDR